MTLARRIRTRSPVFYDQWFNLGIKYAIKCKNVEVEHFKRKPQRQTSSGRQFCPSDLSVPDLQTLMVHGAEAAGRDMQRLCMQGQYWCFFLRTKRF